MPDPEEGGPAGGQAENESNDDALKWRGCLRWSSRRACGWPGGEREQRRRSEMARAPQMVEPEGACGWPGGEREQRRRSEMARAPQMVEPEGLRVARRRTRATSTQ